MSDWHIAILKSYDHHGGCADYAQIYETIGKFITLTANHMRATVYGGRPAYQHELRSFVSDLCEAGDLRRVGRGKYCLTAKGKKRISG